MDWLVKDHLVWTALGAVDEMNLDVFYGSYPREGAGTGGYDPAMMACCSTRTASGFGPRG